MSASIPAAARVVIVGGGIAGASVAYHLSKMGWNDIVLLEQEKLAGGTTWHAAGMVGRLRVSSSMMKINQASADLYAGLFAETGHNPDWRQVGSLVLARNEDRMHQIRRTTAVASYLGVNSELIDRKTIAQRWPWLKTDDLTGGAWIPGDGRCQPAETAIALSKGAASRGVNIIQQIRVTDLLHKNGRVTGVATTQGNIAADYVVLSGGMWSRQLAARAGVSVPLYPVEHHYCVSNGIAGLTGNEPCCRDMDGATYFRGENLPDGSAGIMLGAFQRYTKAWMVEKVPDKFSFQLLEEDWEKFAEPLAEGEMRIPAMKKAGYLKFVNGPESFTPDNNWLMGETPELAGLFVFCGFNSAGIATSGGAGKYLAEWMDAGAMTMDLLSVDIRRFGAWAGNRSFLRTRVTEALGLHYQMAWPNREFETARDVRLSPLHAKLKSLNACFGVKAGWERPNFFAPSGALPKIEYSFGKQNWFVSHAAEHHATRENVAIFDQSGFAKILVRGRDALHVLQRLCGANVDLPVGGTSYTGMFNARGTFESDLTVIRIGEAEFYVVTGTAQGVKDLHWIRSNIQSGEMCEAIDVTGQYAVISVMGPHARRLLSKVTEADLSNTAFPFGTSQMIGVGFATARAVRITYVGELGWELHIPVDQASGAFDALTEAGREFGAVNAGHYAINSLRLEKGYRAYGAELSCDETPLEAGLAFRLDWEKPGGFLGREALAKQKTIGVKKRLGIFVLKDPTIMLWGSEIIWRDGSAVGYTTSGSYGHTVGGAIAMGYIKNQGAICTPDFVTTGKYELQVNGQRHAASVQLKCPVDPERAKILA